MVSSRGGDAGTNDRHAGMCHEIVHRRHLLAFVDNRRGLVEPLLPDEGECEVRALRRAEALLSGRAKRIPCFPEDALRGLPIARAKLDRAALLAERCRDQRHAALEVRLAEAGIELTGGVEVATGGERHATPVEQPRAEAPAQLIPHACEPLVDEALELRPGRPAEPHRRHDQRHGLRLE